MLSAVQNSSTGIGKSAYIEGAVRSTVNDIIRTAFGVVGTSAPAELGVLIGVANGLPAGTFCLARDTDTDAVRNDWLCYTQIATSIFRCPKATNAPGACLATDQFIGTAAANTVGIAGNPTFNNLNSQFTITITSCPDPTVTSCVNLTTPSNRLNRRVTVTNTINIPGHSS